MGTGWEVSVASWAPTPRWRVVLLHPRFHWLLIIGLYLLASAGIAWATFSATTQQVGSTIGAAVADAWLPTAVNTARTGPTTCAVSWTPAAGVPAGMTYTIQTQTAADVTGLTTSPASITVTPATTTVAVRVKLLNWSSASGATAGTTCPGWPDAPGNVYAEPDDTSVAVSWTVPASNGNPVTGYSAVATPAGGGASSSCTAAAPSTSCVISGLPTGADYTVSVEASNIDGTGPASAPLAFVVTADRYWMGGTSATWTNPANWSYRDGGAGGAAVPIASSRVILNGSSTAALTVDPAADATVQSWTQAAAYTGTVTFTTRYTGGFTALTVLGNVSLSGGTWTHSFNGSTATTRLRVAVGGNLTVGSSALIDVRQRGYAPNSGPGVQWNGDRNVGSHGGRAGGSGGGTYGDAFLPVTLGSGSSGWYGGGAVLLTTGGTTTIDGAILADGAGCYNCHGGSAGGSVTLTTGTLAGAGSISVNGGLDGEHGNGGGGRIAVRLIQSGATFPSTPTMTAFGSGYSHYSVDRLSGAGTVYQQTSADGEGKGTMIIANNGYDSGALYTEIPAGQSWALTRLITRDGGILSAGPGTSLDLSGATISATSGNSRNGVRVYGGTLSLPASLTIQDWTLYVDAAHSWTGNWTVGSTGRISHSINGGSATYRIDLTLTGNLTINSGGTVDVQQRGFAPNSGPGTMWNGERVVGSHGGLAGGSGGGTYGDPFQPVTLGSGSSGWYGGGAAKLTVTGTTTLDGTLNANGAGCYNCHGGSAGGSVNLTTASLTGSGSISANGGQDGWHGNGGGGRIAVRLTQAGATFAATPTMTAYGAGWSNNSPTRLASAGTVYQQTNADGEGNGTLIIANNGYDTNTIYTEIPSGQTWNVARLVTRDNGIVSAGPGTTLNMSGATISGVAGNSRNGVRVYGGVLNLPAPLTIQDWSLYLDDAHSYTGNWTIASGGRLTHSPNGGSATYRADLTLTGNLTVNSGGAVDVQQKGFAPNNGPGARWTGERVVGAHGGLAAGTGGGTYGDLQVPITLGSGSSGWYGGGAARLIVSGTTTLNGSMNADGSGCYNCGGGSAGGSIALTTATLTGTGTISSNGGRDQWHGNGGGGRIAVTLTQSGATFAATPSMTAYGWAYNNFAYDSGAGTIYLRNGSQSSTQGALIIDNNNLPSAVATSLDDASARAVTVGTVVIRNQGRLTVGTDDSLTTTGSGAAVTTTANTQLTNLGTLTLSGTPSVAGATSFATAGNTVVYSGQSDNSDITLLPGPYDALTVTRTGTIFRWPAAATTVNGVLTVAAGTLDQSTGNLTAGTVVVANAATWRDYGTNTITLGAGGVTTAGTGRVDLDGAGGGPTTGTTTSITVASSAPGTRRPWTPAAAQSLANVAVSDMGDNGSPAITVTTGSNGGNNGSRWVFVP